MKKLAVFLFFVFSNNALAMNKWVGHWIAYDQWQSEFSIFISENGSANSNYGNGEKGSWKSIDGNLEINWSSGQKDFFFDGVMGYQRIRKSKNRSYTSGLKKSFD